MRIFFAPAIGLMNRLRYTSKFLMLGTAVATVILILLFSVISHLNRDIDVANNELAGVQMLKPLNRAVQLSSSIVACPPDCSVAMRR